jgi:hypothetical protein
MELQNIQRGRNYQHRTLGKVLYIAPHPHDGASLVVEKYDEDADSWSLHSCESSDLLSHVPDELSDKIADQLEGARHA